MPSYTHDVVLILRFVIFLVISHHLKKTQVSVNVQIVIILHKNLMVYFRHIQLMVNKHLRHKDSSKIERTKCLTVGLLYRPALVSFLVYIWIFPKLYSKTVASAIFNGLFIPHDSLYFITL